MAVVLSNSLGGFTKRKFGTSEATTAAFCVTKFPQTLASLPLFLGRVTQRENRTVSVSPLIKDFGTIVENNSVLILPDRTPYCSIAFCRC